MRSEILAVAAALSIVAAVAGCTSSPDPKLAAQSMASYMERRADSAEQLTIEQSLSDLVPSHRFSIAGRKAAALADGIVVGHVTKVEAGAAYTVDQNDDTTSVQIPFDAKDALWRVVVLTVTADTRLGATKAKSVRVGFVIDSSMDLTMATAGLEGMGRVVLVLDKPGFFTFDTSLYSVRQSGALLGTVDSQGAIDFPALGPESEQFVGGTETVTDLVTDAAEPAPVVDVDVVHNEFERSDEGE